MDDQHEKVTPVPTPFSWEVREGQLTHNDGHVTVETVLMIYTVTGATCLYIEGVEAVVIGNALRASGKRAEEGTKAAR